MFCATSNFHVLASRGVETILKVEGPDKEEFLSNGLYQMLDTPGPPESKEC